MILTDQEFNKLSLHRKSICNLFNTKDCEDCPFLECEEYFCVQDGSIDPRDRCAITFASSETVEDVYNEYFKDE